MPLHNINGQWIHYEDSGGNLPAVVLAHGLLMDREMFAPQVEALSSRCRIISWDARCHGETETTDEPFTYWDLADDLRGLLDHLGIACAVIGGMGQGGFVALHFAIKNPERVAALILLGPQTGTEDPEKVAIFKWMLDVWEAEGINDQIAKTLAAIILGNEWPGREAWIAKWRQWPPSLLRLALKALVSREDIHDRFGEIKAPTLVIHGTADEAVDIELAEHLCSELANCLPLIRIEGGGHACNLTHPELVNLAVLRHMVELGLATPRRAERRGHRRRANRTRRSGERRDPGRASSGRRVLLSFDRRIAERRGRERRESWPMNIHMTRSHT